MDQLKVPEAVRVRLGALYAAQQAAIAKLPEVHAWQEAFNVALAYLGVDPAVSGHGIDFGTGIVTPAGRPTPIKAEQAS